MKQRTFNVRNKEETIKQMQDRMNVQKKEDTAEIIRLNEELNKALKQNSTGDKSFRESKVTFNSGQYEAIPRRELEQLCCQKDDQIENLSHQVAALMKEKENLLDNKDDRNKLSDYDVTGHSGKRIKALQMDVDRLTKEIRKKEKYEKKLNATINEITDKLVRLEQMKGLTNEDIKLANLITKPTGKADVVAGDVAKIEELDKMLRAKENRLLMISQKSKNQETELNQLKAELLKLKESEKGLKEEVKNSLSAKQKLIDDFQKERRELKKLEREAKKLAEIGGEQAAGTNLELKVQIKQLEKELTVLKSQARPVVAYNNENKSFEYIGDPLSLHINGESCSNIEEFLYLAKEWLKVNNRITVRSIFNSFDYSKSGYLDKDLIAPIFSRLGIKLHK